MLRVLAHDALAAALLRGFERISFHGYCIEVRHICFPLSKFCVPVE